MPSAEVQPPRSTRLPCPARSVVILTGIGVSVGLLLRWVLQADLASQYCEAPTAWWCDALSTLGLLIHFRLFGWVAVVGGLVSWWIGGRLLAIFALVAAVLGLALYNVDLAAIGFVLALLRLARRETPP